MATTLSLGGKTNLSTRGQRALHRPPLLKCALFENQFCPETHVNGLINLGVAENSLLTDWLIDYFTKNFRLDYSDFTYGTALGGSLRLFKALQHLFKTYFSARTLVLREHVICGSGCGSVIDLLVSCIADAGDGILVSKPYYNGFTASFECRNQVQAVGVDLVSGEEADESAIEAYEKALVESEKKGVKIKAVMLCNPNNPLGFTYSKTALLAYCRFAQKHNIHLISDEIYALSIYNAADYPQASPFVSLLSIDPAEAGCDPSRILTIYGLSKDFGANGLRIGALISQANPELRTAMESSCLLMKISSPADALWSSLLLDPVGLPDFLKLNQSKLAEAYSAATSFLNVHSIPYRKCNAGHFIFIDLRRFLKDKDQNGNDSEPLEAEEELAMRFVKGGVNLARGTAYAYAVPGYFRLTFTLRRDFFEVGLTRMEHVLGLEPTVSVDYRRVPALLAKKNEVSLEEGVAALAI